LGLRPPESSTEVALLGDGYVEALLARDVEGEVRGDGEREEVLRVPPLRRFEVTGRSQALACVLADRLEHPVAVPGVPNEALVDERLERVELCLCDLLGCFECAAAQEDGESREELLLLGCQQLVGPLDRRPEGALPLGKVSGAAREKRQTPSESLEDLRRGERLDTRSGELERERQVVEAGAKVVKELVGLEVGLRGPGARDEELARFAPGEHRHGVELLALHAQALAARHEHVGVRALREDGRHVRRRLDDVLEVVEQEKKAPTVDKLRQRNLAKDLYERPEVASLLARLESIEVRNGRITIVPRLR